MPIITIQRRMAEQGRIRLGQKVATARGGTRPAKLDRFRFTSASQRLIEEIADRYGGTAQPWDNGGKSEWEVISDATSIPVIVVKGGFSQWHEAWTKAGIQHRCDGEKDPAGNYCDPDDPAHLEAIQKPTTRLSVMLSEIETLGVWRMESKGWNAAAELPSMAELAMHVGDLVPATLSLAERSAVIQTPKGPQTSRFVVPVLDLHITKRRLVELVGGQSGGPGPAPALEGTERQAIEAAPAEATTPTVDLAERLSRCETREQLTELYEWVKTLGPDDVGGLSWDEVRGMFAEQGRRIDVAQDRAAAAGDHAQADGELVEATIEPDEPTAPPAGIDDDAAWMQCLAAAGRLGWGLERMKDAYSQWTEGEVIDDANSARLVEFAEYLGKLEPEQVSA